MRNALTVHLDMPGIVSRRVLAYAPGVGKTYSLSEAIRRRKRGEEIVAAAVESHGRKGITELAAELETVTDRRLEYKCTSSSAPCADCIS
jgi:two-component system sensor histidine kinase KdpD